MFQGHGGFLFGYGIAGLRYKLELNASVNDQHVSDGDDNKRQSTDAVLFLKQRVFNIYSLENFREIY